MQDIARSALEIETKDLKRYDRQIAQALRDAGFKRERATHTGKGTRPWLWFPPAG